jgi:hypothetical protein
MKALTICQPYAHLIVTPQAELPGDEVQKRVENRRWRCNHRGPLLIHAGMSRKWVEPADERYKMTFGAILGVCDIVACLTYVDITDRFGLVGKRAMANQNQRWPWLETHPHVVGPWCFVLDNIRRFREPIPYKGQQGLFNIPEDVINQAMIDLA